MTIKDLAETSMKYGLACQKYVSTLLWDASKRDAKIIVPRFSLI